MKHYPKTVITLINQLKKLPSVGQKTALRYIFEILSWDPSQIQNLQKTLNELKDLKKCVNCGFIFDCICCPLCDKTSRDFTKICIIGSLKDVFTIEGTKIYHGTYFILSNLLSPLDELEIHNEELLKLKNRIRSEQVTEVIMALEPTIEGDATTLFLSEELSEFHVKISRLALGIPVGSSLEYVDDGTLHQAFSHRQTL